MAVALERSDEQLSAIVQRIAQLLHARVWAADARTVIIASTDVSAIGRRVTARPDLPPLVDNALAIAAPPAIFHLGATTLYIEQLDSEPLNPRVVSALADLVCVQSSERLPTSQDAHTLKNQFIYNLLFEPTLDDESLTRQGQMLGIDLTIPRAAILIDATDHIRVTSHDGASELEEALMRRRTRGIISSVVSFFHLPSDTICAYVGGGEIVVLKASSARDLDAWSQPAMSHDEAEPQAESTWAGLPALKRTGEALLSHIQRSTGANITLGIGRYHPGISGLKRSYHDARAALSLGRQFYGGNRMHCLDTLGIAAFIGIDDARTKLDLARTVLGPLEHEPELIETVEAFFAAGCSPSATASDLCIHRNTLNYRLEKIASLTGLDPRHFDDAVQIRLALLMRALQR